VFTAVESGPVSPYVDRVRDEPLLAEKPQPGSIVERKTIEEIGVTEWRLSNGARVVMKPTDFKNDEVLLSGFSPGGHSLVPDERHTSATVATSVVEAGGLGEFDSVELRKALTGKLAGGSTYIDELEEGVIGGASPEDLETALQLLYLGFTAPRRDEAAFGSWLERTRAALENRLARPETVFADRVQTALAQDHPRRRPLSPERLSEVDLDAALEIYRDRFADAGDFTFILVGNFEPSAIEPLLLTYLGGLPATGREETWRDVGVRPPAGVVEVAVEKGLEPKSLVRIVFSGEAEWSRQNHHDIGSLASALSMRLRERLREGMAGTYGVSVRGRISPRPRPSYSFSISFGCSPENVDALVKAVFDEIVRARAHGFEESYVAKVKQAQRRQRQTAVRENGFWRSVLAGYYRRGEDPRLILAHDELVEAVSTETLKAAAERYLDTERYVLGTLRPEATPASPTE
jgi:zinc protease